MGGVCGSAKAPRGPAEKIQVLLDGWTSDAEQAELLRLLDTFSATDRNAALHGVDVAQLFTDTDNWWDGPHNNRERLARLLCGTHLRTLDAQSKAALI